MDDAELTPREVADRLGVTVRTVQRWIASGRLPATRVGSRVRVSRSSLSTVRTAPDASGSRIRIASLLVANRAEIAARVARTAHRLGIRVIGIHTADERPHAGADESILVPSYLEIDAILAAARRSGASALHPGYGFLAEDPDFARAVVEAGIAWVGPPPEAIAAMGDKAAARRLASRLGVPVVPGYDGDAQDEATLAREAERIGFPLLVKPAAGGGGKGMRIVRDPGGLAEALAASRREANRSFADDRLILERYLEGSRHVEIQVLFDGAGAGVHLGERDCSAQRRSQKILEEAPAPSVTAELRRRMSDEALRLAADVGYASAGTVEMLLADDGEFHFLEMNTRLQVEHPVTEAVTGRDLVEDQVRIAAGATLAELGLSEPPRISGHAIEARLYAEDPDAGFLPATGQVARVRWPDGVRIDPGIEEGDAIGDRYDPMLAKLVVHGSSRRDALDRLRRALAATTLLGVRTNLRFLRWLVDQPATRDGQMRTDTISSADLQAPPRPDAADWQAAAHALEPPSSDPWSDGWRLNAPAVRRLRHADERRSVAIGPLPEPAPATVVADGVAFVDVEGQSLEFTVDEAPTVEDAARHASTGAGGGPSVLTAPMPGRVVAVRVAAGASVRAHEPVIVIEAMKMEHAVVAPMDATVTRLAVREGEQVERGAVLAEIAVHG